ncbi:MAG: hydrogenase iron-sulfur subunit [Deltaproteobacteria bacterium]|nr:hydrogenase iron-sulfur subunit [Deltaproteobacteria bacterium]
MPDSTVEEAGGLEPFPAPAAPDTRPVGPADAADVRGDGLFRQLEGAFLLLDRVVGRALPPALNPFLQTGAIAITSLAVATVTGVVLLIWYSPSVHGAYSSVAEMSDAPWTAGLMRSLHRYSSDLCMLFVGVHALRVFLERRFAGPRWLAWLTGTLTLAVLWITGWTGYWLVWDERAQHIAVGTARALDVVPIFADPMGRAFLTDAGVNSLLFFVIFFLHMLIPLGLGIGLWLHLGRIARPNYVTRTPMTIWVLGLMLLLSIAYPATSAGPARMTEVGQSFGMDYWYLLPIAMTDRLGGGLLWAIFWAGGIVLGSIPFLLSRVRREAAIVTPSRCNACMQCYQDCPYEAIAMIPRTDGSTRYPVEANVDPDRCVRCGICSGSCDTVGIDVPWLDVRSARRRVEEWVADAKHAGEEPLVAFVCAQSAGARLTLDSETGLCEEMPGYRVMQVPCAGWVHTQTLERAVRRGAAAALVVTCGDGDCHYREGADWLHMRLDGQRAPVLRTEHVERGLVHTLALDRTRLGRLVERAAVLRGDPRANVSTPPPSPALAGIASVVLALAVAATVGAVSDLGYTAPRPDGAELVVTFKHPGRSSDDCRALTPEEIAARPVHMRQQEVCARRRSPVRLRVSLDGRPVHARAYPPGGVWGDGNSVAVETLDVPPGTHLVKIEIGDGPDPEQWNWTEERSVEFEEHGRRVATFDRLAGFGFH